MDEDMDCDHGAEECPGGCMCPCGLCYLLRTEAYTGDAVDLLIEQVGIEVCEDRE